MSLVLRSFRGGRLVWTPYRETGPDISVKRGREQKAIAVPNGRNESTGTELEVPRQNLTARLSSFGAGTCFFALQNHITSWMSEAN